MSEDEIMKILKEITPDDLLNCWEGGEKEFEAIKTILDLYHEDEEIIKRLNTEYETAQGYIVALKKSLEEEKEKNKKLEEKQNRLAFKTNQYMNDVLSNNIISKDKIKEKIESIENMFEVCDEEINYRLKIEDKAKIDALKELLEED